MNPIVAPDLGTDIGNTLLVDNPAGRLPNVIVGVAVIPDSVAVTKTEKLTPE